MPVSHASSPVLRSFAPLGAGARVALVAPAGPLRDAADVARAQANARSLGWEPVVAEHVLQRQGFLAGDDALRLGDLERARDDATVDAIWCMRGGYGSMRLLQRLDYTRWRASAKPLIGFSDITALHHALAARAGAEGMHGPCARGTLTDAARDSLRDASARRDSCGVAHGARALRGGRARGPLVGGNLAVMAALVGTPFLYVPSGAILLVEDVNEPVYRIDRMLRQLQLSGILARCSALLFGAFTERGAGERDGDASPAMEENGAAALASVLNDAAAWVSGPVLAGVPVGHIDSQWTWRFGAPAEVDAEAQRVTLLPD